MDNNVQFYYVATGLKDAVFVFSFSFAGEGDLYVRSVWFPQNPVKCGRQCSYRTIVSCACVIFITLFLGTHIEHTTQRSVVT